MEILYGTADTLPAVIRLDNGNMCLLGKELPYLEVRAADIDETNALLLENRFPRLEEWFAHELPVEELAQLMRGTAIAAYCGASSMKGKVGFALAKLAQQRLVNKSGMNESRLAFALVVHFREWYKRNPEYARKMFLKLDLRWSAVEKLCQEKMREWQTP